MSTLEREVVLEGLSALLGVPVKPYTGLKGTLNVDELCITNLLTSVFCKHVIGLSSDFFPQMLGGLYRGLRKELFVDMDGFFDPQYDYDFTYCNDKSVCWRGDEPYKRPCGWNRFALKVLDKYPDGNAWLGTDGWRSHSVAGEWPVSYHGTSIEGAAGIVKSCYAAGSNQKRQVYGRGIYSTYDIEQAFGYSTEFTSETNRKTYRVIMQNRINPQMRKVCSRQDYWLIEVPEGTSPDTEKEIVEKSIRPYGILLKEV